MIGALIDDLLLIRKAIKFYTKRKRSETMRIMAYLILFFCMLLMLNGCNLKVMQKQTLVSIMGQEYIALINKQIEKTGEKSTFTLIDLSDYWYGEYDDGVELYQCNLSDKESIYLLLYEKEEHSDDSYMSMHLVTYGDGYEAVKVSCSTNIFIALADFICFEDVTSVDISSLINNKKMDDRWIYDVSFVSRYGTPGTMERRCQFIKNSDFDILQYKIGSCYNSSDELVFGQEISLRCKLAYKLDL